MKTTLKNIAKKIEVREDYFQRLFALGKERIAQLNDEYLENVEKATYVYNYVVNLLDGTVTKFGELDTDEFRLYALSELGFGDKPFPIVYNGGVEYQAVQDVFDDVFVALGNELVDFYAEIDDVGKLINCDQLIELNRVWDNPNPNTPPLRELIAILRNLNLKHNKNV